MESISSGKDMRESIEAIARIAYGVARRFEIRMGIPAGPKWEDAPEERREGMIGIVAAIYYRPNSEIRNLYGMWKRELEKKGEGDGLVEYDELGPMLQVEDEIIEGLIKDLRREFF